MAKILQPAEVKVHTQTQALCQIGLRLSPCTRYVGDVGKLSGCESDRDQYLPAS